MNPVLGLCESEQVAGIELSNILYILKYINKIRHN